MESTPGLSAESSSVPASSGRRDGMNLRDGKANVLHLSKFPHKMTAKELVAEAKLLVANKIPEHYGFDSGVEGFKLWQFGFSRVHRSSS